MQRYVGCVCVCAALSISSSWCRAQAGAWTQAGPRPGSLRRLSRQDQNIKKKMLKTGFGGNDDARPLMHVAAPLFPALGIGLDAWILVTVQTKQLLFSVGPNMSNKPKVFQRVFAQLRKPVKIVLKH